MQNPVVRNNYIHEEKPDHIGIAVSRSANNQVYNNVIYNTNTGIGVGGGSSNNYIGNNILLGIDSLALAKSPDTVNNTFENNLVFPSDHTDHVVGHLYKNKDSIFRNNKIALGADISISGIIKVTTKNSTKTHNTDISPFSVEISSRESPLHH